MSQISKKAAYSTCAIKGEGITLIKYPSERKYKSKNRPSLGAKNALKSAKTLVPFPTLMETFSWHGVVYSLLSKSLLRRRSVDSELRSGEYELRVMAADFYSRR